MGIHGPHRRNTKPATAAVKKTTIPVAPDELGEAGRAAWVKLASEMSARVELGAGDCALLAVVCRLHDAWAQCSSELENRPDPGSVRALLGVTKQIQSGLAELGLTRRARSAMGIEAEAVSEEDQEIMRIIS